MRRTAFAAGFIALGLLATPPALAAGSGSAPAANASSKISQAWNLIEAGNYAEAIGVLNAEAAAQPNNADAQNMLGYAHRKSGNYDASMIHYEKALALDPDHKGAHEYIGELYLTLGQPEKAEAHLARLDAICWLGCEEYDELKAAIAAWRAQNGG